MVTAGLLAGPANAEPDTAAPRATDPVTEVTDRLAAQLTGRYAAEAKRFGLFPTTAEHAVNLADAPADSALGRAVRAANREVLAAKGLPADSAPLLTVRLADPSMVDALRRGVTPLVASSPSDDEATSVTAYGRDAKRVLLDAERIPHRPVYLVEVDSAAALAEGMDVIQSTLAQHGQAPQVRAAAGYWATQVTSIRLRDDAEPWHKGKAEIFAIAAGFGQDGKVKVDTVEMPYLDHDDTTYYPGQLLVHFSSYKYNLADLVLMEEDSGTNYRDLALALAQALLTIVDGGVYIPLVNAILNALPDGWWTDDPDYVDSFYTLSTATAGTLTGAANNATMTVAPYWVAPL
ncbi:hypothetical protein BLA60_29295 [Actinophytocola xinjiangensis]|uniref:DUF3103 family protein n=2 Tax=Actinophytocola xinjiangensis TaxID=485602 RepID=A0A7Z1AVR6_9PSEU|nr:hypothetical protein BLA60_29295 [Actinophytocola xinjiangensis]